MFTTRHDLRLPGPRDEAAPPNVEVDQAVHLAPRRGLPAFGPFASLSSAVMTHLTPSGDNRRKEQATGMEFPEECCVLSQKNCPVLTGFG